MSFEWLYLYLLPFMGVITVVVFFHELGHYLVAKFNKVQVDAFSIGFGPELFGFTDRAGTRWKFSLLPLGGYVKMYSDVNAASQPDTTAVKKMTTEEKAVSLFHKTVWQRICVSAAGPIANYIFAIVVLSFLYAISGQAIPADTAKIGFVESQSPAAVGGLQLDDQVIRINEQAVATFEEMTTIIRANPGNLLNFEVTRGTEQLKLQITPRSIKDKETEVGQIGVAIGAELVKHGLHISWLYASEDTFRISWLTLKAVRQIIVGERSAGELTGPIGIAQKTGEFASTNLASFVWFVAFISISLGLINLFPIPMLDGGHLVFYFIEAIRGKPLSDKIQEFVFRIGFVLLMALMLFVVWNDLDRLGVFNSIRGLF